MNVNLNVLVMILKKGIIDGDVLTCTAVSREVNRVADALAKHGLSLDGDPKI